MSHQFDNLVLSYGEICEIRRGLGGGGMSGGKCLGVKCLGGGGGMPLKIFGWGEERNVGILKINSHLLRHKQLMFVIQFN